MITIRRANIDDIPNIMRFLDEHWKPGSILAINRDFFEWQFVEDDGTVNVFIGIDEAENKIYGTYGVILYSKSEHPDMSGCTWQVIHSENPVLGLEIPEKAKEILQFRYSIAPHITETSCRICRLSGISVTTMDHYYRLNPVIEYRIAGIVDKIIPKVSDSGYRIEKLTSVDEMKQVVSEEELLLHIPSKSYDYIEKRYWRHPIFRYDFWKICDSNGHASSVMITREITYEGAKCIKIIDYYGRIDDFKSITYAVDNLLSKTKSEFIDVYSYGVSADIYERAGFVRCDKESKNIIPNYFQPYVRENISLYTHVHDIEGMRYFRGDGDQDRPV